MRRSTLVFYTYFTACASNHIVHSHRHSPVLLVVRRISLLRQSTLFKTAHPFTFLSGSTCARQFRHCPMVRATPNRFLVPFFFRCHLMTLLRLRLTRFPTGGGLLHVMSTMRRCLLFCFPTFSSHYHTPSRPPLPFLRQTRAGSSDSAPALTAHTLWSISRRSVAGFTSIPPILTKVKTYYNGAGRRFPRLPFGCCWSNRRQAPPPPRQTCSAHCCQSSLPLPAVTP